jgi:hypothetical protein
MGRGLTQHEFIKFLQGFELLTYNVTVDASYRSTAKAIEFAPVNQTQASLVFKKHANRQNLVTFENFLSLLRDLAEMCLVKNWFA